MYARRAPAPIALTFFAPTTRKMLGAGGEPAPQMDGDAADIEFEIGRAPNRRCGDLLALA